MEEEQSILKQLKGILTAYKRLYLAVRTTLEMAEPLDENESSIHPEVLEELNAAYQAVYLQINGVEK